MDVAMFHNLAH